MAIIISCVHFCMITSPTDSHYLKVKFLSERSLHCLSNFCFQWSDSFICVDVFCRVHRIKKDRRQKESQRKQKAAECRKHLTNIRSAVCCAYFAFAAAMHFA